MVVTPDGVIWEWTYLHSALLGIAVGVITALWSWREWRHSDLIRPGSYRYRRYEAYYYATHWVRRRDFSGIASKYMRRVAKRGFIVSVCVAICGAVFAVVQVL